MLKKTDTKITRYKDRKWIVDIVEYEETTGYKCIGAYLQHEDYGVSKHIFSCEPTTNREYFLKLVEANLDDYKEDYMDKFFD